MESGNDDTFKPLGIPCDLPDIKTNKKDFYRWVDTTPTRLSGKFKTLASKQFVNKVKNMKAKKQSKEPLKSEIVEEFSKLPSDTVGTATEITNKPEIMSEKTEKQVETKNMSKTENTCQCQCKCGVTKQYTEYLVISVNDPSKLKLEVQAALSQGWELVGGVSVATVPSPTQVTTVFAQAIAK